MKRKKDLLKNSLPDSRAYSSRFDVFLFIAVVFAGFFYAAPGYGEPNVPPTISTDWNPNNNYIINADIKIQYTVSDPDGTGSISERISEIKFYYTNDLNVAAQVETIDPATAINSAGKFNATINKTFVSCYDPIYFGIIVKDTGGASASHPTNFAVDEAGKISSVNSNEILMESCSSPTTMCMPEPPYPDQFPFAPKDDGSNLLKINFSINAPADVTMRIYSLDGRLTRMIENSVVPIGECAPGEECNRCNYYSGCQWDGRDVSGRVVGSGMYVVNIHAKATGYLFTGAEINYTKGIVVMK